MSAPLISVGIVGAGAIVHKVHLPVLANQPDARVAWIVDADDRLSGRVARSFGVTALKFPSRPDALPPCDLMLLATPLHARAPYLELCAARGTPVFAEKPFAPTRHEHTRFLDLLGDTPVWCGYVRRAYANVRMLRAAVQGGWFGALQGIRYAEGGRTTGGGDGSPTLDRPWREGGGVLRDLGCHGLDAIHYITDAGGWQISRCAFEWDAATDRHVRASLHLQDLGGAAGSGCELEFTVSWLMPQSNTIELRFERAALRCGLKPTTRAQISTTHAFEEAFDLRVDAGGARGEFSSYHLEWREVIDSLAQQRPSTMSAASSLWTTRLVEDLYAAGGAP